MLETIVNLICSLLGWTPQQLLVTVVGFVFGVVSVPVTNWFKGWLTTFLNFLDGLGFLKILATWLLETEDKIVGWFVVVLNAAISFFLMWLVGEHVLGLTIFSSADNFNQLMIVLGVNSTAAQMFFEFLKSRKAKAAATLLTASKKAPQ